MLNISAVICGSKNRQCYKTGKNGLGLDVLDVRAITKLSSKS